MSTALRLSVIACGMALLGRGAVARACSLPPPPRLTIAANPADTTPPSTPQVRIAKIRHGRDGSCAPHGDCTDLTYVVFEVAATDDLSAGDAMGYEFETDRAYVLVGQGPIVPDASGRITLYLNGPSEASGPDLDVRVFAVDKAGNVSTEPARVTVDRSDEGCRLASSFDEGALWGLAVIALLMRRRARHAAQRTG